MSFTVDPSKWLTRFDPATGTLGNAPVAQRHLADLRGCFRDTEAFERKLAQGNPLVYTVAALEPATGEGDLHCGLGTLYPGLVGDEYFLTKGHLHTWRAAAEMYIGLLGQGVMLLEDEASGESRTVPLEPQSIVYVPGYTAHRTLNVGEVPLVYLGVYPARAGHDYQVIAQRNFRSVVVRRDGRPCLLRRRQP
jgi:glucose-6-phosphate isomerase